MREVRGLVSWTHLFRKSAWSKLPARWPTYQD
jgi:hypothetical protein